MASTEPPNLLRSVPVEQTANPEIILNEVLTLVGCWDNRRAGLRILNPRSIRSLRPSRSRIWKRASPN